MNSFDSVLQANQLAESIEFEIRNLRQAGQTKLLDLLGGICSDLSLFALATQNEDEELVSATRKNLAEYGETLRKAQLAQMPMKTRGTLRYRELADLLDQIL